jgi:hypothetical protein
MKKALLIPILAFISFGSFAQEARCFAADKMREQMMLDPGLAARRADIEEQTQRWIAEHGDEEERAVLTIPVVVHVVYKTAGQNISDAQILSQIEVLNEDYRLQNSDASSIPSAWNSVKADSEIEFCLAVRDPDGFPTTGITRTETTVTSWNGSDNVKLTSQGGKNGWPSSKYLNIWVCNIGAGLLGFAYQPGVSASLDGLVIGYKYFGTGFPGISSTYDLGRTATHEIGHYLNLDHPWGGGDSNPNCNLDDAVSDTPIQEEPNYGCQSFPHISCNNGPNGDMFNNYMDYGNDDCLFLFTNGQKQRMRAAINGPRAGLKTSLGCVPTNVGIEDKPLAKRINVYPNPADDLVRITMDDASDGTADVRILNLTGAEVLHVNTLSLANGTIAVDHLPVGIYILEVTTANERASHRIHIIR